MGVLPLCGHDIRDDLVGSLTATCAVHDQGASFGHVWPILIAGVRCFFERDVAAIEELPEHARHETLAVGLEEMIGDLGQRHVGRSLDQGENLCSMTLDPS
ncbi:hypothetical protein [Bradyrhizobium sp. AZCC 2230]|uniref:hypothetical protein n=1 Tax=Bradyrhizobium sp. AZCC 2230 TaxID=3117021 RepID=UPI002FF415F3